MEDQVAEFSAAVEELSREFLGRWNKLVSTTNWEKGRIICRWRQRLVEAHAPAIASTDEAWSKQVGNVTPQHVGRLRRVYQRFNDAVEQYPGLYWSHFQATLEWPDAEMYLQGAVSNHWSVAQMREQRFEAMGGQPEEQLGNGTSLGEESLATEWDEDAATDSGAEENMPESLTATTSEVFDPGVPEEVPFDSDKAAAAEPVDTAVEPPPFENVPSLPSDLADVVERFKLAIVRHKASNWQAVDCRHVLAALDGLKQLAVSPVS